MTDREEVEVVAVTTTVENRMLLLTRRWSVDGDAIGVRVLSP